MSTPAHLLKTARRQMRKIRERGPQTETERRLLSSADRQREQGLGWRYDGFAGIATIELLRMLAQFSVVNDEESFKKEALEAGSPTALAARWEKWSTAEGRWKDLTMLGARELWRRLLPHELRAEVVADEIDELLEEAEVTPRRAELWLAAARRLVETCLRDGRAERDFFQQVVRESGSDLAGWMIEMPSALIGTPGAEQAPWLCEKFAELIDAKSILAERAELLARLGRREEALAQIESLLQAHPNEPVVLLKAGGTYEALGEADKAQLYLRFYTEVMQNPHSAASIAAASKVGVALPPRPRAPGVNEKCPCGSGKKYKRCHGLAS
ncbi:MAG: SEC-C metal-binding domain-containing protein [Myxococcales bacterium]|jgi:tetratricopeptide (TPR) repeat protein